MYVKIVIFKTLKPVYNGHLSITDNYFGPVTVRYIQVPLYCVIIIYLYVARRGAVAEINHAL